MASQEPSIDLNSSIIRKLIVFCGTSRNDLRDFSRTAKLRVGQQLDRVERGLNPDNWKPMPDIGPGVRELRVRDEAGAFRAIYVASRPEAVYVLHAFQKKTQATARRDIELAKARFRELPQSGR